MKNKETAQEHYNRTHANQYKNYEVKQPSELLDFLMSCVPGATRTKAKQWLSKRMVYVDKVITTQFNTPLQPGQLVQISKHGNEHALRNPFVKIVYEDAFLLVVEKAEGILTNTPEQGREQSLKRILDEYVKRSNRFISTHTVHRLDRFTSGLLVFAKKRDVQQLFMNHWHELVTDRRYMAVVEGEMEKDYGTVESWLTDTNKFMTYSTNYDNGGKYAVTHYKTLKRANGMSLVEFQLETGRKNQIRVHMQTLGHSLVGDLKYGATTDPIGRVCLHACKLAFIHPITHEQLSFDSPIPPAILSLITE